MPTITQNQAALTTLELARELGVRHDALMHTVTKVMEHNPELVFNEGNPAGDRATPFIEYREVPCAGGKTVIAYINDAFANLVIAESPGIIPLKRRQEIMQMFAPMKAALDQLKANDDDYDFQVVREKQVGSHRKLTDQIKVIADAFADTMAKDEASKPNYRAAVYSFVAIEINRQLLKNFGTYYIGRDALTPAQLLWLYNLQEHISAVLWLQPIESPNVKDKLTDLIAEAAAVATKMQQQA